MMWTLAAVVLTATVAGLLLYRPLCGGDSPMPSTAEARRTMLAALARLMTDSDLPIRRVVDLGSGWGGLARMAARLYPTLPVVGVEVSIIPYLYSRGCAAFDRAAKRPVPRFLRRSIRALPLCDETAYLCYLSSASMRSVRAQFEGDQPRNGVLISCAFAMPGWTPVSVHTARDLQNTRIYVYRY